MKTYTEWIKEYRKGFNPITGEQNLYKSITDQMIWDAAQESILNTCESCKWYSGSSLGGICSTYPCDSCRTDKWEEKDIEVI